jgi:hypothetical protein
LTPFPPDYLSKNRGNHGEGGRSFDSVITIGVLTVAIRPVTKTLPKH